MFVENVSDAVPRTRLDGVLFQMRTTIIIHGDRKLRSYMRQKSFILQANVRSDSFDLSIFCRQQHADADAVAVAVVWRSPLPSEDRKRTLAAAAVAGLSSVRVAPGVRRRCR